MGEDGDSKPEHNKINIGTSFLAGVLFIFVMMTISFFIKGKASNPEFFTEYIEPLKAAAVSLGFGHYFGKSLQEEDGFKIYFMTGAFSTLLAISIYSSHAVWPENLLLPALMILPASFALITNLSPLVSTDEAIESILGLLAGPVTTLFVILVSSANFLLSHGVGLRNTGFALVGIIILTVISLWVYAAMNTSTRRRF